MSRLSHVDDTGRAKMVDVGAKAETARKAVAQGVIRMSTAAYDAVREGRGPKGAVLSTAELAGIMGAKRTADLVPLCHPLPLDSVDLETELDPSLPGVRIRATARTTGRTGVEMEALTAVSVAALTIYDMAKAVDRSMRLSDIRLLEKRGGVHGDYVAENDKLY